MFNIITDPPSFLSYSLFFPIPLCRRRRRRRRRVGERRLGSAGGCVRLLYRHGRDLQHIFHFQSGRHQHRQVGAYRLLFFLF